MKTLCEICKKREVGMLRNIGDNPFVIPFEHEQREDGKIRFRNKNVHNICDKCYAKIEKTMRKLMGL